VGALTSRNPIGLHGLEQGYLYFYFLLNRGRITDVRMDAETDERQAREDGARLWERQNWHMKSEQTEAKR
jgi:hypothetical protein